MDARQLLTEYMNIDGPAMDFIVQRDIHAQDRDGLGAGISQQAMEDLNQQVMTFIGTRMMRFQVERGVMPQNLKVELVVTMEV